MLEHTLSIIKPDAVERDLTGTILTRILGQGLKIKGLKMLHLDKAEAQGFYAVHQDRPFFDSLTSYMSSGPIVVAVLAGESAINRYRELMGATNPKDAVAGTLRKDFALDLERNSVHGSDAPETARTEISYFFNRLELVG
jgi:nucleoside-diphosphate kinase